MSTLPDNEFDLEKLFLPAWAQDAPSSVKYAKYEGEEQRSERRGERRGPRFGNREGGPGGRRGGPRPGGERGPQRPGGQAGPSGFSDRGPRGDRPQRRDQAGDRRGPRRFDPNQRREPPAPLPEIDIAVVPDERGVESLARQIKMSGRAYPLFDIAQMILQKPERHGFVFTVKKNPEGQPVQPLFVCALDDTLWLSENEAVSHVLKKHFNTFYQAERTATEPPKGKYTFVAQCAMSGIILGPPNHHDYQNQLRKLHAERFSRLPFEVYKSRVKIVRDEEVVKKWVEDQSFKTEYVCLNMPEPLRLADMEAVEKHFRENHKDNIIKQVDSHTASGMATRGFRSPELSRLVRSAWEDQRRFPLQIATVLSQQFAGHGLQFFKVNRTITHVSVARPHYLDLDLIPVSDGVKRIVDFINVSPKCTRRQLIEGLAPTPAPAPVPVPAEAVAPTPVEPAGPTPEQTAVIADLHWLVHQGHVIEFANGVLETAKKPLPKPPKPEPKVPQKPAGEAGAAPAAAQESPGVPAAEPGTSISTEGGDVESSSPSDQPPQPTLTPPAPTSNGSEPPIGESVNEGGASTAFPQVAAPAADSPAADPTPPEQPVAAIGSPS